MVSNDYIFVWNHADDVSSQLFNLSIQALAGDNNGDVAANLLKCLQRLDVSLNP